MSSTSESKMTGAPLKTQRHPARLNRFVRCVTSGSQTQPWQRRRDPDLGALRWQRLIQSLRCVTRRFLCWNKNWAFFG